MAASDSRAYEALESKLVKLARPLPSEFPELAELAFTPCSQLQADYLRLEDLLEQHNLTPLERWYILQGLSSSIQKGLG